MSNYSELLKDPRWQKKRLYVMYAQGWACQKCGDETTELHVHHKYYKPGVLPWDYPSDCYECLCSNCHKKEHGLAQNQNHCIDGREVRTIRQVMIDAIKELQKKYK